MNESTPLQAITSPVSSDVTVHPARGLRNKVVRVPCIIRPVTKSPGFDKKERA